MADVDVEQPQSPVVEPPVVEAAVVSGAAGHPRAGSSRRRPSSRSAAGSKVSPRRSPSPPTRSSSGWPVRGPRWPWTRSPRSGGRRTSPGCPGSGLDRRRRQLARPRAAGRRPAGAARRPDARPRRAAARSWRLPATGVTLAFLAERVEGVVSLGWTPRAGARDAVQFHRLDPRGAAHPPVRARCGHSTSTRPLRRCAQRLPGVRRSASNPSAHASSAPDPPKAATGKDTVDSPKRLWRVVAAATWSTLLLVIGAVVVEDRYMRPGPRAPTAFWQRRSSAPWCVGDDLPPTPRGRTPRRGAAP